jgi:hypothetical protein
MGTDSVLNATSRMSHPQPGHSSEKPRNPSEYGFIKTSLELSVSPSLRRYRAS